VPSSPTPARGTVVGSELGEAPRSVRKDSHLAAFAANTSLEFTMLARAASLSAGHELA